jgi:hypothetical protein
VTSQAVLQSPIVGWGISVIMNAWDITRRGLAGEDIDKEIST